MEKIEKHKMLVEMTLARFAYLEKAREWVGRTLRRIETAQANAQKLPESINQKYVDRLHELQPRIEGQIVKDVEVVLEAAREETMILK